MWILVQGGKTLEKEGEKTDSDSKEATKIIGMLMIKSQPNFLVCLVNYLETLQ